MHHKGKSQKRRARAKGIAPPSFATLLRQIWKLYRLSLLDDAAAARRLMRRHPEAAKVAMAEAKALAAIFDEIGVDARARYPSRSE